MLTGAKGFCIGTWLAGYNNRQCPTCREPALGAKYHPQLDQVAQAYIETHPELKMPEPEIAERREFYRPGSRVCWDGPFTSLPLAFALVNIRSSVRSTSVRLSATPITVCLQRKRRRR